MVSEYLFNFGKSLASFNANLGYLFNKHCIALIQV